MVEFTKPRVYGFCNQEDNNVKGDKDCMGSKTKSWLALALVIAMLFGMAVPTAFAAEAVVRQTSFPMQKIGVGGTGGYFDDAGNGSTGGNGAPYAHNVNLSMGMTPLVFVLGVPGNTTTPKWSDTPFTRFKNNNKDFTLEVVNSHPNNVGVAINKDAGTVKVTPTSTTTETITLTVTVKDLDPTVPGFASKDHPTESAMFQGKIELSYKPAVTVDKNTVTLDIANVAKVDGSEKAVIKFTAARALKMPVVATSNAYRLDFVTKSLALPNSTNTSLLMDGTAAEAANVNPLVGEVTATVGSKEQTLTLKLNPKYDPSGIAPGTNYASQVAQEFDLFVLGSAAGLSQRNADDDGDEVLQDVTIRVKVINSNSGWELYSSRPTINVRRDSVGKIDGDLMEFSLGVRNASGIPQLTSTPAADIVGAPSNVKIVPAAGYNNNAIKVVTSGKNFAIRPANGADASAIPGGTEDTRDGKFTRWEGYLVFEPNTAAIKDATTITGTGEGTVATPFTGDKLTIQKASPAIMSVKITPVEMTVEPVYLTFDRNSTTAITNTIEASIVGGGKFSSSGASITDSNAKIGSLYQGDGKWSVSVLPANLEGLTHGTLEVTNSYDAYNDQNGTIAIKMPVAKVFYTVVDTTPKTEVVATPSGEIVLDLNNDVKWADVKLSMPTGIATNDRVSLTGFSYKDSGFVTAASSPASVNNDTVRLTGVKIGKTVVTVNGQYTTAAGVVHSVKKEIDVRVVNSKSGVVNAISVTPGVDVELTVMGEKSVVLTATLVDGAGSPIAMPANSKFTAELRNASGESARAVDILTLVGSTADGKDTIDSTDGKFTLERKNLTGDADVKITFGDLQPITVHVKVVAAKLVVTPEKVMNLDLEANKEGTVVIRNSAGGTLDLSNYNVELVDSKLADGKVGTIATIKQVVGDAAFTVTATKAGTARLKATGTIAGVASEPHYIDLTVTDKPVVNYELSVEVPELRVGGTAKVSYSLLPTGSVFDADSVEYTLGAGVICATIEGDTLTGVAEGTAAVKVSGTIGGVPYEKEATFTVLPKTVVIGDLSILDPNGIGARPGIANVTGLFVDDQACVGGGYDPNGNPVVITGIGKTAYGATLNDLSAKIVKNRSVSNKVFAADIREGVLYYKAKAAGYWMVELETSKGSYEFYFKNTNTPATKVDAPSSFTLHAGERIDLRSVVTVTPANANKATLKYKVQNNGVLRVTTTGILLANKAGTGKVQILNSKKTKTLATITVNVDTSYTGIKFASAYLFQDQNSDETKVAEILSAANFGTTPAVPAYKVLATSAVGLNAELTQLATQMAGVMVRDDIFTFYFSGTVAQKGIAFADGTVITFDELATIAGKLPCQVFMIFDCSYSGSFISKGAIQNSLFKAVAKANASYAKTVGAAGNGKAKLHVLLATDTATGTIPTLAKEGQKALTSAFVKALSRGTDGNLAMGGTKVTMDQLYSEVKKTATNAGMYPLVQNGDAYPIYAIQPLPANP